MLYNSVPNQKTATLLSLTLSTSLQFIPHTYIHTKVTYQFLPMHMYIHAHTRLCIFHTFTSFSFLYLFLSHFFLFQFFSHFFSLFFLEVYLLCPSLPTSLSLFLSVLTYTHLSHTLSHSLSLSLFSLSLSLSSLSLLSLSLSLLSLSLSSLYLSLFSLSLSLSLLSLSSILPIILRCILMTSVTLLTP